MRQERRALTKLSLNKEDSLEKVEPAYKARENRLSKCLNRYGTELKTVFFCFRKNIHTQNKEKSLLKYLVCLPMDLVKNNNTQISLM